MSIDFIVDGVDISYSENSMGGRSRPARSL